MISRFYFNSRMALVPGTSILERCKLTIPAILNIIQARHFHDRSQVPRIVDDREKKMHKVHDTGYFFRYHRNGIDPLPRIEDCRKRIYKPKYKIRQPWRESQARFGENDCIDLLGNGTVHPAQLQYHIPRWLRGFPGSQNANELIRYIHYRNLYQDKLKRNSPWHWHQLCKNINYFLQYHNYHKNDEIRDERNLGLWKQEPDYYYKDKSRRSYKDLV